ncbi:MAG TPA: magnesium/cobalt transporter CorA [Anaerolineales bacterium]|nr:magnesium and cobalt transport protein CorA [Anaerolineae bacterium]HRJ55539.1 magnesium/cobalt transporter CorA [Anaerolineales bacterium]HRK90261.1 magnesium/cobalt transporter CorA [Anaerolineales bacterium]
MIRSLFYIPGKTIRTDIPPSEFPRLIRDRKGVLWVDFIGETPEAAEPILRSFGFHPLAIDDALQETHTPKVDDWGDHLYIVLNVLNYKQENGTFKSEIDELDVFLGKNYIITHHDQLLPAVEDAWSACQRDNRRIQDGPDHLLYRIVDSLVMSYMPLIDQVDAQVDQIEDQVFDRPRKDTLENIFALKRLLLTMRRILLPQREVLNKLSREDYRVIDPKDRVFFRDIYDHLVRLHDLNENLRDLVSGVLDSYLSVTNNRMNEVMKTLTIITTLFMPITFVTGFFGMNFFEPVAHFLHWTSEQTFDIMLGIMVSLPIVMYLWMRRRTWV